jgi:molecular chaperone GrpE (heat shock protein)
MGYAVRIYELFKGFGEEQARVLAEFVEQVESRKAASSAELKETELKLHKEIELVRKELKETELRLQKEIEQVKKELKETELRLQKEIGETKATLIKWMFAFWTGQIIAIAGLMRLFLK